MANKKSLLGGVSVKVENRSGFDKSHYNAFTAPLGAIVPMVKQLMLPGKGKLSVKLSAQLPPLASDAFLRTHLKVEAFLVPLRLCYGGFQSWFSGEPISAAVATTPSSALTRAQLPRLNIPDADATQPAASQQKYLDFAFGPHSLMDYFGVKVGLSGGHVDATDFYNPHYFNIFPFIAYQLCYHHWYRNKLVQRPLFAVPDASLGFSVYDAGYLPYMSFSSIRDYVTVSGAYGFDPGTTYLLNGGLLSLRQRNYGFDYFTTALPSAQDGSPMSVNTSGGSFTISALRSANALQDFAERNQVAGPDFIQVCRSRYGKAPSSGVASRPVLLGSADFPMFTSGVEQSAPFDSNSAQTSNPFEGLGARYGRAHAEGQDFVCEFDCDEPSYLMVMCSLVPEANYSRGIAKDMTIFTQAGSIVDLPNAQLERIGMEPIDDSQISNDQFTDPTSVFGYQPRYMWHKAGQMNEVHGLFREGASLESFIPQRTIPHQSVISDGFLTIAPTDLDNVTAVSGALSQ